MSNNIVNNYSTTIVTIFQSVVETYERNLEIIQETQDEIMDLEHEAELGNPKDLYHGWLLYKALREARIRRRTAKQENELLKDLYEFFTSQNGQSFKNKIQNIQGNAKKLQTIQEARNDLTIENKHSEESQNFEEMLAEFKKVKPHFKGGKLRK